MVPTSPTTERALEDRRTERRALAGAAASLALHVALLGAAWASAPPLAEAQDDEPLPEQAYLLVRQPEPEPLPPPDAGCIVPGWCLASATWSIGLPIPGWHWEVTPEVRACFGDDGEPGLARGERDDGARPPSASRLGLGGLIAPPGVLPWRSPALGLGAAAGAPQPTIRLAALATRGALSREEARDWIWEAQARHLACYQRALRDTPWLRGQVRVKLALEGEEAELEVKGAGGVERDEALLCCLRGVQEALLHGAWREGPSTLRYTLALHPGAP